MTESAFRCDRRFAFSGIPEHSFTKRKVINNRRTKVKTIIVVCSYCGRTGSKTESKLRR